MACTTILVGKNASYDGSTMIARNDDSGSGHFTAKKFTVFQSQDYPAAVSYTHLDVYKRQGQGCWTALLNEDSIRPRTRAAMADVADGLARLPKLAADNAVRFLADQLGYGKYLDKNGMDRTKLA